MRKTYQITEYGSFVRDKEVLGSTSLPPDTFDALENFVLSNNTEDADALELMSISARKGVGKIITAKNYVGVITMDDGIKCMRTKRNTHQRTLPCFIPSPRRLSKTKTLGLFRKTEPKLKSDLLICST